MKNNRIGIIYKYTSPSGKIYIGQTMNEKERRKKFLGKSSYAGKKIDTARKKYGPSSFIYEVLETFEEKSFSGTQDFYDKLDEREIFFISEYDSFKNGYNMSTGGKTPKEILVTDSFRESCRQRCFENNPFKGKSHTNLTKNLISEKNSKAVLQIDPITDEVLMEFKSSKEAGVYLGHPRANSEIVKVCKNYVSPSGKRYLTCLGFKWRYKQLND